MTGPENQAESAEPTGAAEPADSVVGIGGGMPPAVMGEGQVVAMAGLAWLASLVTTSPREPTRPDLAPLARLAEATLAPRQPTLFAALLVAAVAVVAGALAARRPWVLVVGVGLLAALLGHRADLAYGPAQPADLAAVEVAVIDDPRPVAGGWAATLRLPDGSRVQARGWGSAGFGLRTAGAGDRLRVTGRLIPIDDSPWARSRHLVGRVNLDAVEHLRGPGGPRRLVEAVRSRIVAGADPTPPSMHPLYLGLVVGEDRFQPPEQRARFAAAGLSHLLAVSGQNVAFVLAVLRPVTDRLGRRARFGTILAVLAGFAVATRLEPSVLRASVVAAMATTAALGGNRQSGVRLLALAVTGLLLVDPFLVHSIGFQLSVAASAGILLLGPVIDQRLPVPRPLAGAVGVTVSAQLAVAPIIGRVFGPVSLVSVPANLIGGWAAGVVMMWGLTFGVVAGIAGGWLGRLLQAPPTAAMWWLDRVAAWAARVPLPAVTGSSLVALLALSGAVRLLGSRPVDGSPNRLEASRRSLRIALLGGLCAAAVATVPGPPDRPTELDGGGWYVPPLDGSPSVLVIGADANDRLLDAIVGARVTSIDIVIVESGSGPAAAVARSTAQLVPTGVVLAPPLHRLVGGTRVTTSLELAAGTTTLTVVPDGNRLSVDGHPLGPP